MDLIGKSDTKASQMDRSRDLTLRKKPDREEREIPFVPPALELVRRLTMTAAGLFCDPCTQATTAGVIVAIVRSTGR